MKQLIGDEFNMKKSFEGFMKGIFLISAIMSIVAIILICIFIFAGGIPFIKEYGIKGFLFSTQWKPTDTPQSFGILPKAGFTLQ